MGEGEWWWWCCCCGCGGCGGVDVDVEDCVDDWDLKGCVCCQSRKGKPQREDKGTAER